jgi:hypothetical protein
MYSPIIVAQRQAELEKRTSIKLLRHSIDEIVSWVEHLDIRRARLAAKHRLKPEEVTLAHLNSEEREFVRNELLLSSIDFDYWSRRYCFILQDAAVGGGLHRLVPWGPQVILAKHIAALEEEQVPAFARGEAVKGILIALHKARQLGATAYCRALIMHRLVTQTHLLAVTASVDDTKVLAIQERDERILNNLPWWMQPHLGYAEKGLHMYFDRLDTKLQYQTLVQKSGLAQGEQYALGHITEAASDPYGGTGLQNDYVPAIPQAPWVLHVMETTAQGRNNWWRFFVEETRKGFSRWHLVFIPWYAEPRKYRLQPPAGWKPTAEAMKHGEIVYRTSKEYTGQQVVLSRENLYWWEFNRADALRNGKLNIFLTNYCATIEESFQHTTTSVFPPELLAYYRDGSSIPSAFDIVRQESRTA